MKRAQNHKAWELQQKQIKAMKAKGITKENAEKAAEAVVRESYLRWKREEEGVVDDITCIILFLDVKLEK